MMRILLATDGSSSALAAARFLGSLPLTAEDGVTIITINSGMHQPDDALALTSDALAGSPAKRRSISHRGYPAAEILRAALREAADLIVVGSRGRSPVLRVLLGSVAEDVVRHAPCPVLVVRPRHDPPRQVVVGIDGSDHAARAAHWLQAFPLPAACEVRVVAVLPLLHEMERAHVPVAPPLVERQTTIGEWTRDQARERLEAHARSLAAWGKLAVTECRSGDPAQGLLQAAEDEGADLIVVGSHGAGALERLFLGSVSEQVLRHASCPVLVVKGPAPATDRSPLHDVVPFPAPGPA